jgi:hypothetical protein
VSQTYTLAVRRAAAQPNARFVYALGFGGEAGYPGCGAPGRPREILFWPLSATNVADSGQKENTPRLD